jgi:hypothetical protein
MTLYQQPETAAPVARIVELARRFWLSDLRRDRFSFAVTCAARLAQMDLASPITVGQKLEAEEILRKGRYGYGEAKVNPDDHGQ